MKLSGREAEGYFAKPDPGKAGLLIFGRDGMRVALKRQQVIAALVGPAGEAEMRLTRMSAGDLRREPALLVDAVKATGFFPGPRAVFVEDGSDAALPAVEAALADWREGDAQIVVTAGDLKPASKLRKLFEGHRGAYAVGIYDDPPSRAEIERQLSEAGLRQVPGDTMEALIALSKELTPGDFRQTLEKVALYKVGDDSPLALADIDACAPLSVETGVDAVLDAVALRQSGEIGPLIQRLAAQGVTGVTLCIGAVRHFRQLYALAAQDGRPARAYNRRMEQIQRQAREWSAPELEKALGELTDTDLLLRSAGQTAPAMAVMERCLIRLAMIPRRS